MTVRAQEGVRFHWYKDQITISDRTPNQVQNDKKSQNDG